MKSRFFHVLFFVLGFAFCFILLRKCSSDPDHFGEIPEPSRTIVIHYDTIWPEPKVVSVPVQIPGPTREIPVLIYDSSLCKMARVYSDSLADSSLVIYYRDSVIGKLLDKKISYKLKIPREIKTTITITDSIPYQVETVSARVYGFGELGLSRDRMNLSLGADFLSQKKWGIGYRYGILDRTHGVSFKFKIF